MPLMIEHWLEPEQMHSPTAPTTFISAIWEHVMCAHVIHYGHDSILHEWAGVHQRAIHLNAETKSWHFESSLGVCLVNSLA